VNDTGHLSSPRHADIALQLIGLLSLAALVGCFSPDLKTGLIPPKVRFGEILKSVAELRGLAPKRAFEIGSLPAEKTSFAPSLNDETIGGLSISELEQAYKQLGLLDARDDLKIALEKFYRLEQLISYDSARDRLLIAADAANLGAQLPAPYNRAATELPVTMGIVQALQEQYFQWQEQISRTVIEDVRLAYRAVAGGDALITALAHGSDGNLAAPGHLAAARQVSLQMDKLARDLPPFLRKQLLLPFREGSDFVAWAIKAKGPAGLNALYAKPPDATAQILHPERYYLTPQTPQRFSPAGLLRHMEKPALFEQSLGEYLLRGLLETENSLAASSEIAAGWRGDQLFSFADSGFQTTAWYSAWGSATEAAAFERAFQTIAEKRQRLRLRRGTGADDAMLTANTGDGDGFALARKNNIVLYLVTRTARLADTAVAAWEDLAVEAEPAVLRFDFARGRGQLSLSKR
jgi:hypothetical protein